MLYSFYVTKDDEKIYGKIEANSEKEAVDLVRNHQYLEENITRREEKNPNILDEIGVWLE